MSFLDLLALSLLAAAGLLFFYTYFGYPMVLGALRRIMGGGRVVRADVPPEWPTVSISVPVYNEAHQIRGLLESLLALDYPKDLLQILVISDASSDGTDEIVRTYGDQGVELHRVEGRGGKTRAEAAGALLLRGEIVLNTDASIRIDPHSVKPLIAAFADPEVGLASGRDVSVDPEETQGNVGESGYVGYEMSIRDLETRVGGIVGASGCFYAIRRALHQIPLPDHLSRDFASALLTREAGFRAVSVPRAICYVPRTTSLRKEFRRKVRTIARGMDTLWHKRVLLNPFRFGSFSWMLFSHKVCRWALPWLGAMGILSLGFLAPTHAWALILALLALGMLVVAWLGWLRADHPRQFRVFSVPAYLVLGNLAALVAFLRVLGGDRNATWEPTRRKTVDSSAGPGSSRPSS